MDKIKNLRISGKYLSEILTILTSEIKEGVTGLELDEIMFRYCKKNNIEASFKGFKGYFIYNDNGESAKPIRENIVFTEVLAIDAKNREGNNVIVYYFDDTLNAQQ